MPSTERQESSVAMKPRCAILAAEFAREIVDVMVAEASREAADQGAEVVKVVRVPGAYETPLLADALLADPGIDFVVVLGFIERGQTQHGEVMGHVVHRSLVELQLKHCKPLGIGVIGPGATVDQAEVRKVDYARVAVRAALHNWNALRECSKRE
jgi:6,7-dimethyl-8-ribityllumazine synthase